MSQEFKLKLKKILKIALVVFVAVFLLKSVFGFGSYHKGGRGEGMEHTIAFTGHGEVNAVPDIANVYFTINKEAKTVKEAQAMVAEVEKKSLDFLRANNILDKDIKTTYASFSPKYEYVSKTTMPCTIYSCPPNQGNSVIVGYTASESITVKVRNTDDVGSIMQGLGALGVSDLNGPNFAIDDEDMLKAEARRLAIADAKQKARVLAKDLGVRLAGIVSFIESGDYYPVPMYAKTSMTEDADLGAPAELPKGENTISSDVTITYELK